MRRECSVRLQHQATAQLGHMPGGWLAYTPLASFGGQPTSVSTHMTFSMPRAFSHSTTEFPLKLIDFPI